MKFAVAVAAVAALLGGIQASIQAASASPAVDQTLGCLVDVEC